MKILKSIILLLIIFQGASASPNNLTERELRDKINANYSTKYTLSLEDAYGFGMTSEGGTEAIEKMFKRVP